MNDTENDKSPSQWLLKIIGGIEILIAGLLSLSFLSMLFGVIFTEGKPPHGHSYLVIALLFLTPFLMALWSAGIVSWQGQKYRFCVGIANCCFGAFYDFYGGFYVN
ncbi:hypothetical protein [Moraxella bovis]|uniref:Uncharacterized protein n=1 Tax=Moraxella bovis TaxID=476 RepID=A0A378PRB6_MORBO|nr:hypothetical protein [Moraxella bovis]UYZ68791.1 hypothetical protein LP122_01355 [Moraxella bovis]UYZ71168.1 hypothetical protein LP089_01395 [Moraxella bovis]UYZ72915.1 hypothetical protein LP105_11235 [Moraxella bovis]UYZ89186.1 hypothetical protein LP114_12355 [Moraxella bovis]UZA14463.1 hypothetical protein LP102_01350 [Moraxella bovis]